MKKGLNAANIFLLVITALLAACASHKETDGVAHNGVAHNGAAHNGAASAPIPGSERAVPDNAPQSVRKAAENAPQDALVGIGSAQVLNRNNSLMMAEARSRTDIARQINNVSTVIIRTYSVKNEIDPSAETIFRETLTVSLSRATLSGVSILYEYFEEDGACWVVTMMTKPAVITQIVNVIEEAKEAVPSMASFDVESLLNAPE